MPVQLEYVGPSDLEGSFWVLWIDCLKKEMYKIHFSGLKKLGIKSLGLGFRET